MPHLPPDIHYILDSSMEFGEITKSDLMYFLQKTELNIIDIFDTYSNPMQYIKSEYLKWYQSSTSIEKSTLFYYFLRNSEFELDLHTKKLSESILKLSKFKNLHIGKSKFSIAYFKKQISDVQNIKTNDLYITELEDNENNISQAQRSIKNSLKFFELYKKTFTKLKKNVKHSLNECMLYANNGVCNTPILPPMSFESLMELQEITKNKQSKIIESKMKTLFKKSLKTVTNFIGDKNVSSFFNGNGFIVEGKLFNFEIKKSKQQSFLKETSLHQSHIPYKLNVLNKNNEFLCSLCIVFKECPVLDQVLSIYMMIKAKQEKEILNTANVMERSDLFYTDKNIMKVLNLNASKQTELRTITNTRNLFSEETLNMLKAKVEKEKRKIHEVTKISNLIKNQLKDTLFQNHSEIFNFIFYTGLCWDEMKDHHLNGFNNNQLDYLINN